MKLRDNQTFMSLYYEPDAVEVATGEADSFASVESWQTTQLNYGSRVAHRQTYLFKRKEN